MMKREFTTREKVLLLILAVLLLCCGYYLLVAQPTSESIQTAAIRQMNAEDDMMVEEARAAHLAEMRRKLDSLDESSNVSQLAAYDNVQNVVRLLNDALAPAETYNLLFNAVAIEGSIANRTVDMSFSCASYDTAIGIIDTLYNAPYRCQITGLTLRAEKNDGNIYDGPVAVTLSVTFFEYIEAQPGQAALVSAAVD